MSRLVSSFAMFLLLIAPALAFHNSFSSLFSMKVVDTNGRIVGMLLGNIGTQGALVGLKIGGEKYGILVRKNGFEGAFAQLFYESNNCTGQAYMEKVLADSSMTRPTGVAPEDAVNDPDNETLHEADTSTPDIINAESSWNSVSRECMDVNISNFDVYPADPIFNLSSKFSPPYTWD